MFPIDWDLSSLLEGAAASPTECHIYFDSLQEKINTFSFEIPELFDSYQLISDSLSEAGNLVCCFTGEDTSNAEATTLEARVNALVADFDKIGLKIDEILLAMPNDEFSTLKTNLGDLGFYIEEKRILAKEKMSTEKESLVTDLSVSGLHGLMSLYFTYMGELEFKLGDKILNLSQLESSFGADNRETRVESLKALEDKLTKHESIFAQILNNIVDVRLRTYSARGWDDYLHEALRSNRTSRATVDAMWSAIAANKKPLIKFMSTKANLMGLSQLEYADYRASIPSSTKDELTYDKSAKTIIDLFTSASPKMGAFAERAMRDGWVTASVTEKKRAGGFCANFPLSQESRILMAFSNCQRSQSTLAHELGHAFHNEAMKDLPAMQRDVPCNLAETASTMCEMMVHDNAIRNAKSDAEKLSLLDTKLTQYIAFNMDLHARYLFDCAFHEKRKDGFVPPAEISKMMINAQEEGFAGSLHSYLPHFWAYKMHFYLTDAPFYNWTYTFGYLFSLGVYAHLRDSGDFEQKYIALLQDSGSMTAEQLAEKHLGVDLTKPDFWQGAIDMLNADIEEYITLSKVTSKQSM